jgi:hypothetical protein
MKTWNYRLMVDENGYYSIREVFYDENKNIDGWTDECSPFGEDLNEIQQDINYMLQAFQRDILVESEIMTDTIASFKEKLLISDEDDSETESTDEDPISD